MRLVRVTTYATLILAVIAVFVLFLETQTAWFCTRCCLLAQWSPGQKVETLQGLLGAPSKVDMFGNQLSYWNYPKFQLRFLIDDSTRKVVAGELTNHSHL